MKRTHLKAAAAFAAALLIAFSAAGTALAGESGDKANSWRYKDGQKIQQDCEAEEPAGTLSAISTLATSTKQTYCWKKDYGLTKMYDAQSGHGATAVSGAREVCVDVSVWDGSINWKSVAADGITSAIIRCGYGSNFSSQDDKYWLTNVKNAQAAGIKIGVYLYSYATRITGSDSSAASEGQHVLRCLEEAGLTSDSLDLPIYIDIEESYQEEYSGKKLEAMILEFAKPLEAKGYKIGVYAGSDLFTSKLNTSTFNAQGYSKWVPHYNNHCMYCKKADGTQDAIANYGKYLDIWQFGSVGKVNGISGNCDVNFIFNDIQTNKVRYVLNGGINSSSNPSTYTDGGSSIALANPKRPGYSFKGWYTSASFASSTRVTSIDCSTGEKLTFYAKWAPITYKVTYKLNKGYMPSTGYTKYFTIETDTFRLPIPSRTGYGFAGWYRNSACTGSKVTKVYWGSTESRTLYAKWVKGAYNAKVTASSLSIRKKASSKSKKVGTLSKNTTVLITRLSSKKTWGYVSGKGWIKLKYAPLTAYYAKVTASSLTARKGAGTSYAKTRLLKKSTKIWVYERSGTWGHARSKGWVKLKYTTPVQL